MINLELTESQEKLRSDIKGVAAAILRPIARKYDEAEHAVPEELEILRRKPSKKKSADKTKKEDGKKDSGSVLGSNLTTVISLEEMCWGDVPLTSSIPGYGIGNASIDAVGTVEQKKEFGRKYTAFAITEPQAGSDTGSLITTAVLDGDEWVLNGEKIFVSAADRCEAVVVWATVDKSAGKAGIKPFFVEKGTPGLVLERLEHKMGFKASDTGVFLINNCRIPKKNLLGDPEAKKPAKEGFKGVMRTFDNTRPIVATQSVGVSKAALESTRDVLEENGIRLDYHKAVNSVSSRTKEYYRMEAHLEAMRLLIWRAAWMADSGKHNNLEASMSKAKAGRWGTLITQKCCDILGPIGFTKKNLLEKWMRDSKVMDIFEGTGQIQHLIVARNILKLSRNELK
ncbi:MAG: acyl-CoA dehydrogenase [Proteobacteria bacterium]|nr:acyl-CoA dehydrogenase [Pseudomonadota bacterium]